MRYRFEPSLEGLLTAVFVGYREIEKSQFIEISSQAPILAGEVAVPVDPEKSRRVKDGVTRTFGWDFYRAITLAFRAEDPEKNTVIARVIKGAYVYGRDYLESAEEEVVHFMRLAGGVQREIHATKSLLKFQEIRGGYLLAEMAPQSDILDLMMNYFKVRMPREQLIIIDEYREKMGLYKDGVALYHGLEAFEFEPDERDEFIEQCWVEFYRAVKIDQRGNLEGMEQHLPKRFLKYPPEGPTPEL